MDDALLPVSIVCTRHLWGFMRPCARASLSARVFLPRIAWLRIFLMVSLSGFPEDVVITKVAIFHKLDLQDESPPGIGGFTNHMLCL